MVNINSFSFNLESVPDFKAEEFDFLVFKELLRTSVLEAAELKNEETVRHDLIIKLL